MAEITGVIMGKNEEFAFCDKKSIWRTFGERIFFEQKWPVLWRMIKIAETLLFTDKTRNKKITDSGIAIRYFWSRRRDSNPRPLRPEVSCKDFLCNFG